MTPKLKQQIQDAVSAYGRIVIEMKSPAVSIDIQDMYGMGIEKLLNDWQLRKPQTITLNGFDEDKEVIFIPYYRRFVNGFTLRIYGKNYANL